MTEIKTDEELTSEARIEHPEGDSVSHPEEEATNSKLTDSLTTRTDETEAIQEAEEVESTAVSDNLSSGIESSASLNALSQSSDAPLGIAEQPYKFEECTVQIAVQLLPEDGDAKGRPVLLGVRTHLDAPILQVLRLSELGELPPAIITLVDQLKSELPAREQAAKDRIEKDKLESLQRRLKTAKPPRHAKQATPEKPKTLQAAAAPARTVLTANQRANAVNQAADEKQQLAMF